MRRAYLALLLLPLLDCGLFFGLVFRVMERVAASFVRIAQVPLKEKLIRRCVQKPRVSRRQVVPLPIPEAELPVLIW